MPGRGLELDLRRGALLGAQRAPERIAAVLLLGEHAQARALVVRGDLARLAAEKQRRHRDGARARHGPVERDVVAVEAQPPRCGLAGHAVDRGVVALFAVHEAAEPAAEQALAIARADLALVRHDRLHLREPAHRERRAERADPRPPLRVAHRIAPQALEPDRREAQVEALVVVERVERGVALTVVERAEPGGDRRVRSAAASARTSEASDRRPAASSAAARRSAEHERPHSPATKWVPSASATRSIWPARSST